MSQVSPIPGELMRYYVSSESNRHMPRVVDLAEYQGNGCCLCPDFITRREPAIKKGAPLYSRATLCKHLIAARTYFLNETLKAVSDQLNGTPKMPLIRLLDGSDFAAPSTTKASASSEPSSKPNTSGERHGGRFPTTPLRLPASQAAR